MLSAALDYVRENPLAALAIGVVLILLAVPSVPFLEVCFGAGTEISYHGALVASTCGAARVLGGKKKTRAQCASIYRVDVGNTGGTAQPEVRVTFHGAPDLPVANPHVLDIVATNAHHRTPEIAWQTDGAEPVLVIRALDPDVLVQTSYTALGLESARRLRDMRLSVAARGRVIDVDPRSATFLRALTAAAHVLF